MEKKIQKRRISESLLDLMGRVDTMISKYKSEGLDMRETFKRVKQSLRDTPRLNTAWLAKYVRRNFVMGEARVAGMMGMKPLSIAGSTSQTKRPTMMDVYLSELKKQEDDGSYAQPPQLNPMRKTVKKAKMRSVGFMSGM